MTEYIQAVSIDWQKVAQDSYLRSIPAIASLNTLSFTAPVTFFVGENGTGKSTLLEAIAVAYGFNPEGGTRNYAFSTYDSHSELHEALRIVRGVHKPVHGYFLRAESFYNVATAEEGYADALHPSKEYHMKSHGESFLALAQDTMRGESIYLFDEPEAALSPQRQLTLLIEICRCAHASAQFIIASHSPILLGMPGAAIYSFDEDRIEPCEYEDTDSFRVTELFINHRENLLHRLLEE